MWARWWERICCAWQGHPIVLSHQVWLVKYGMVVGQQHWYECRCTKRRTVPTEVRLIRPYNSIDALAKPAPKP